MSVESTSGGSPSSSRLPQVTHDEVKRIGKAWRPGGLVVPLDDMHIRFAADVANLVLKNFVQMCAEQAAAAMKSAKAAQAGVSNAAPAGTATVANPVEKKSSIILTD